MKNKMTFSYQYDNIEVKVVTSADAPLDQLLPQIAGFLRACTYVFDGELVIEDKESK